MRKFALTFSVVAGLAAAGSAKAADIPLKAPPPAAPMMSWTGCYLAGGVGYGMWNQDHFGETLPGNAQLTASTTSGGRGWLGRVGAGCDYQFAPSWVVGVFGDYDFADVSGFADISGIGGPEKMSAAWAVGGRIGYLPYPNLMTYVSGGWTQARFDQVNLLATPVVPAPALGLHLPEHTYSGWFLGTGFEYAAPWFRGLFWRTEYRFAQYDADDIPILVTGTGAQTGLGVHSEKFVQTITSSLVWKFNWPGSRH